MATEDNFRTARQWGLTAGPQIVEDIRSSGTALRMLHDVCTAVTNTVKYATSSGMARSDDIVSNYPRVLDRCDSLTFNEPAQAVAYLALHLPDRYCRVFQVLEQLLTQGMLPIGRPNSVFSVADIGAGPGPGVFAIRNFYAALSHATSLQRRPVATVGSTAIVERSPGMGWAMHHFAESLIELERGPHPHRGPSTAQHVPHPYASELRASATPFGASYEDFGALDFRDDHNRARHQLAYEIANELDIAPRDANRLAYEEPIGVPSGYAIAIMTNFLTDAEAVPRCETAIQRLMNSALVPGGIVLVLGGAGRQYPQIYKQLDQIAVGTRLHVMNGFDQPLQAGRRPEELTAIRNLTRRTWAELSGQAENDVTDVLDQLHRLRADDIFDESLPFRLPRFQVRVYRRGR